MNLATRTSLALVGALLLAGCSGGTADAPADTPAAPAPTTDARPAPTTTPAPEPEQSTDTSDPADTPDAGAPPAACAGVATDPRELTPGDALGECIVTAMVAAGSGRMTVAADDGEPPTEVEFRYDPELSLVSRGPDMSFVVVDDTAWLNVGGQWHREGDGSTMGDLLTDGLGALRAFSDPRASAAVIGACPEWESSGLITHADAGNAIAYECTAPFEAIGVTMSAYRIVVDPDFLGIESVGTGDFMGFTTTTTQTFRDWGEPVEIPRPEVD